MLFCTSNLDIIIVKKKEKVIFMKHKHKVVNRSTFDAKVNIVTSPNKSLKIFKANTKSIPLKSIAILTFLLRLFKT